MALISKPNTFSAGNTIVASEHNSNFDTIYNEFNGSISNANISNTAAIVDSKLAQITTAGKVSGAALTSLSSIPSGAGTIPTANLPTIVSRNYRSEMFVEQASTTTMTVSPGILEVDDTAITKTSSTTLTLTTAADWAGGSSLRAVSTTGYVGVNASGEIRMHTTAPTHSNYDVDNTNGTKRYVTWSGTVYRVIGWFRMNSTGSGELDTYGVGNLAEMGIPNQVVRSTGAYSSLGSTTIPLDNTIPQIGEGNAISSMTIGFRPTTTTGTVALRGSIQISAGGNSYAIIAVFQDGAANAVDVVVANGGNSDLSTTASIEYVYTPSSTDYTEFTFRVGDNAGNAMYLNGSATATAQRFNGKLISTTQLIETPNAT